MLEGWQQSVQVRIRLAPLCRRLPAACGVARSHPVRTTAMAPSPQPTKRLAFLQLDHVVFPQRMELADAPAVFRMGNMERNINNGAEYEEPSIWRHSRIVVNRCASSRRDDRATVQHHELTGFWPRRLRAAWRQERPDPVTRWQFNPSADNPTTAQQDTRGVQGTAREQDGPAIMPPSRNQR